MKKGTPTKERVIPTGNSLGAKSNLPNKSASKVNEAPIKAELINKDFELFPQSNLAIWGTIRPIKPTRPAKVTTDEAQTDANIIQIKVSFL